jgi:hypothetical protein
MRFSASDCLRVRIFGAHAIRAADVAMLHRVRRFIVGAAGETAAQIRLGYSRKSEKSYVYVGLRADCDGSRCAEAFSWACRENSVHDLQSPLLSYCFIERITGDPVGSHDTGRTSWRHQLRVFCATPSRKRHLEPVIGAVLHCMSELTG